MDIWRVPVQVCSLPAKCLCYIFRAHSDSHQSRKVRISVATRCIIKGSHTTSQHYCMLVLCKFGDWLLLWLQVLCHSLSTESQISDYNENDSQNYCPALDSGSDPCTSHPYWTGRPTYLPYYNHSRANIAILVISFRAWQQVVDGRGRGVMTDLG